jgi:hypothetical protein
VESSADAFASRAKGAPEEIREPFFKSFLAPKHHSPFVLAYYVEHSKYRRKTTQNHH